MMRRILARLGLALPVFAVCRAGFAEDLPPATHWIPAEAAVVFEANEPMALLGPLLDAEVGKAVTALAANGPGNLKLQQLQGIVAYLELQLQTNWRTGLERLMGRNLTLAFGTNGEAMLCADGHDEKMLQMLHETARHFATAEALKQQHPERVSSKEYRGFTAWTLAENEAHAMVGTRLLLSNSREALDRVLDLRAEPDGKDVTSSNAYQAAREAVGKDAAAWLYVNMKAARQSPKLKEALSSEGNPVETLALADAQEALRAANWLAVGVYVRDGKLVLKTFTDGEVPPASKAASFATLKETEGLLPELVVPASPAPASIAIYAPSTRPRTTSSRSAPRA